MYKIYDPLEQFETTFPFVLEKTIHHAVELLSVDAFSCSYCAFWTLSIGLFLDFLINTFNITDSAISLIKIYIVYILLTKLIFLKGGFLCPRNYQIFIENIYSFLASTFKDQVGYRGQKYFPFLSTIFFFVLLLNIFGMIPYEGAVTSQLIFNLSLSFLVLAILTIIGFHRQGKEFLNLVVPPKGIPTVLVPLLLFIEIVSYFLRGISLGVRLFANIIAGHTLLFIFASFILSLGVFLGVGVFIVIFLVTFLEFFIATLQAYVFYVLTLIYFRDSIEVQH